MAAPLLIGFGAGCGDFWQAPGSTTTTTCTTNCTTASSGKFYILNAGTTPQIVGDTIASGTLTAISGSPWTLEATPYAMAIDRINGDFLIVSTTSGVFSYPVTNGALGTGVITSQDAVAEAIQVDATDSWLIEAIPGSDGVTIGAVPIVSTTGASNGTEQTVSFTVANASVQPGELAISGDNANIFVSLGPGGTIIVPFNAAAAAGTNPIATKATTIPVTTTGGSALSVGVDPGATPRLFYIGETLASGGTTGGLRAFTYSSLSSTTLTQASGSPLASGGLAPNFILSAASGEYVYVANGTGAATAGNVAGFTITASSAATPTYTVAADTTTAAGVQPLGLAEDSTGTFVLEVGSLGSPYFDAYTFDTTTLGQLDSQIPSTTSAGSIAIVAAP